MEEYLQKPRKYKLSGTFGKILIYASICFLILFSTIFVLFDYYGEILFRRFLQEKISKESSGLYQVGFNKLEFNLFTGSLVIKDFVLTPDTSVYIRLKQEKKIHTALYIISFRSLTVKGLNPGKFYFSHLIRLKRMQLEKPEIFITAFPDQNEGQQRAITTLYDDINSFVLKFFRDFHVGVINVDNGIFNWKHNQGSGRTGEANYSYSVILRDFEVHPGSIIDPGRFFFSSDIEFKIKNFQYSLADSLYFIKATEAGFSLKKSQIFAKNISLSPNYNSERINEVKNGNFFQINLPELNISGVDIRKTFTEKRAEIGKVQLEHCGFKIISTPVSSPVATISGKKKQIRLAGLYTIIAGELKSVSIRSLILDHADFSYFRGLSEPEPELKIGNVSVTMDHFFLDSLANKNPDKILFAKDIDLTLENFKLAFRDKIHTLVAGEVTISTKQSVIDVTGADLSPLVNFSLQADSNQAIFTFRLPKLTMNGVDLRKTFNKRILEFDHLMLSGPDLRIRMKKNQKGNAYADEIEKTFPDKSTKDVLFDLVSPYLEKIKANGVTIKQGSFRLSKQCGVQERPFSSGQVELELKDFCLDSVHHFNQKEFLYSRDINIWLRKFFFETPDSNHILTADHIYYSTDDSLVQADNFKIRPRADINLQSYTNIGVEKILVSGLDNSRLLTEQKVFVKKMKLIMPSVRINENKSLNENSGNQHKMNESGFIKTFSINHLTVINGLVDVLKPEKNNTVSFSINGYDLNLDNLQMEFENIHSDPIPFHFDSLTLKSAPSGFVIAGNMDTIRFTKLVARSNPSDISIQNLHFSNIVSKHDPQSHISFSADVPQLMLKDLSVTRLIRDKNFIIKKMVIRNPDILLDIPRDSWISANDDNKNDPLSFHPGSLLKYVNITELAMDHAHLLLANHLQDTINDIDLADVSLGMKNFIIDSTYTDSRKGRLFNSDDIRLQLPGYSWVSDDSLYTLKVGKTALSTRQRKIVIDSFSVVPNLSKYDFPRKLWHQQDRVEIKTDQVEISGIHFRELLLQKKFSAGKILINGMILEDHRDKRVPLFAWQTKPLPQQMLLNLKTPVNIDSVQLLNGIVTYSEQTEEIPGIVFFDRLKALATHITNDTASYHPGSEMTLEGSAYLMGQALLQASFHFPLAYRKDTFNFSASIGEIDLMELNPLIVPLTPLKIKSGYETRTIVQDVSSNNDYAKGSLEIYYNDLKIDFRRTEYNFFKKWRSDLMTFMADDIVLPSANPANNGKFRKGVVYYERDKNKGFFNYIWKSTWSGLKSSVGLNTKQQREIKREQKKESSN
jgi:hypothetical protein